MRITRTRLPVAAIAAAMTATSVATAGDLRVPQDFPTIQSAIDAAQPGDVVLIADGVYGGEGNRDIDFLGKAITVRSENGPGGCAIDSQGTYEKPYRGFIFQSGEGPDSVLEGVTITGGATLQGAIADIFNGGGVFIIESSPTIRNCVITGNICGCWGAGVYSKDGNPTLIGCDITGNAADDDGGGVFSWLGGTVTLINCNVSHNSAPAVGGGIAQFGGGGSVVIVNSTIADNSAGGGSGVFALGNSTMQNSIVWGNMGNWGGQVDGSGVAVTYSNVEGGYPGVGNINADPLFADTSCGDYRVLAGSPVIDAGSNAAVPNWVEGDFLENPRFHDDLGMADTGVGSGAVVDMGSTEFQGHTGSIATLADAEVVFGSLMSGGPADLVESDDSFLRTRSAFGFSAFEPNLMELLVGTDTDLDDASLLDVTIESRINQPNGTAKVRLKNWSTGLFQQVGTYGLGTAEEAVSIEDVAAGNFVGVADGRIEVSIKNVVMATFSLAGFDSFIDHVRVLVN